MQIEVSVAKSVNNDKLCTISHKDEKIQFVVNYFIKNTSTKPVFGEDEVPAPSEDLFKYVNEYLEKMSMNQQNMFFNLYKQARDVLTNAENHDDLVIALRDVVTRILDFQDFYTVHRWLRIHTDLAIPSKVEETFVEDAAGRNKQNKTYIRSEYEELVTLAFLFRLLLPIYGEFIARISAYTDATSKEMITFNLASMSEVMESNAMIRLVSFVENTVPKDTNKSPALIDGISSDDYTKWLLSLVMLRRLIVGALQDTRDGATLVSFIYGYIVYRASNNASFGGFIKDKKHPNAAPNDVNELSSWEEYRIKERNSAGDIALVQCDLEDANKLYWRLCIGLDETVSKEFEPGEPNPEFMELMSEPIGKGQIGMLKYIVSPLVSHRLLDDVERPETFASLIAGAAYLKRLGLLELAILLTAVKRNSKVMIGSSSTVKHRITPEQMAELNAVYPYVRKSQSRQTVVDTKTSYDVAFAAFEDEFKKSEWRITLPHADIVRFTGGLKITRAYTCPTDIRPLLADFFIAMDAASKRIHHHRQLLLKELLS